MSGSAGKGDKRRPTQIGREEESIRRAFALGAITKEMFEQKYEELVQQHKIIRDGRVIRGQAMGK